MANNKSKRRNEKIRLVKVRRKPSIKRHHAYLAEKRNRNETSTP